MQHKKIIDWLSTVSNSVLNPGDSQDIHIDEFIGLDKNQFFYDTLELAKHLHANVESIIKKDYRLFIYVALESNTNVILGVPRDYNTLLDRIELSYPPEVVLYKEFEEKEYNKVELYKSCLPFEIEFNDSIDIVYRELRGFDELENNENYTRELHLIIK